MGLAPEAVFYKCWKIAAVVYMGMRDYARIYLLGVEGKPGIDLIELLAAALKKAYIYKAGGFFFLQEVH